MSCKMNFGSRTEFLPGERSDDIDIKYERYGGCFVTYKKGFLCLLASLLFTAIVSYLVYYNFTCMERQQNVTEITNDILAELLKSAEETVSEKSKEISKISNDIKPSFYHLKIQPFLNEMGPKNFSFEGQVSIVFEIIDSPTKEIILNAKDIKISENDVSLTYFSKSKVAPLVAASQTKENNDTSPENTTTLEITTTEVSTSSKSTTEASIITTMIPLEESNVSESKNTSNIESSTVSDKTNESASEPPEEPENTSLTLSTTSSSTTIMPEIIVGSEETSIEISKQSYNANDETYTIKLIFPLEKGINYTLKMKFSGKISESPGGIFRSKYQQRNETFWLVNTLFKPFYARTVFPCFDQPNLKTKFEIAIARQTNMSAVSNMFLKETYPVETMSGWVWDHFETTPPMSTHSVAFAVFGFNSAKASNSVPFPLSKIWGRAETTNKGTYTLKVAPKLIETYNKFFGYNYSLNKVDLVAIPNLPVSSYGSWGILFFSENELLVEDESSFEEKEKLLHILSRELAQEWFGNLISVQSWHDSWLIETINSYAHYIGINAVEPTWEIMDESIISDTQDVLDIDQMNVLPKLIDMPANIEIENDLELLLSKKGSSIMNLVNLTLTGTEFLAGIQNFVNKWKYKNFNQDNLWAELNTTNNLPTEIKINDVIKLWTTQKGYPLITIKQLSNQTIEIQQDKFSTTKMPSIDIWITPLSYITSSFSNETTIWLSKKSSKIIDNSIEKQNNSWVLFNSNGACLCRVNYELDNWNSLISLLKNKPEVLSPSNRARLLDDAFHLARTEILNYTLVLDMTLYLKENEKHFIPWITALRNFRFIDSVLSKTPNYGYFEDFMIKLLEPMYNNLMENNNNKKYSDTKLQKMIMEWLCKLNYKPFRDWASTQFDSWISSPASNQTNTIQKDFRSIVYCVGVQNGGRLSWEFLWQKYQLSKNDPDESKALITGMGCSSETWLLMKYFMKSLSEESLPNSVLMWTTLSSEVSINSAFEFLRENWSIVFEKYKRSQLAMKKILHGILTQLTSKNDLEHMLNFFTEEKSDMKKYVKDIIVIIEKLKEKVQWKNQYTATINSWIRENNK